MNISRIKISFLVASIAVTTFTQAFTRKDVTINEVGLSTNTNRVFIKATPIATNTDCSDTSIYAIELNSPEAYLFYSAALTAMNHGKKMRVQYEQDKCAATAPRIDVFWNLNQ